MARDIIDELMDGAQWEPVTERSEGQEMYPVAQCTILVPQFRGDALVDTPARCVLLNNGWRGLTTEGADALGAKPTEKRE